VPAAVSTHLLTDRLPWTWLHCFRRVGCLPGDSHRLRLLRVVLVMVAHGVEARLQVWCLKKPARQNAVTRAAWPSPSLSPSSLARRPSSFPSRPSPSRASLPLLPALLLLSCFSRSPFPPAPHPPAPARQPPLSSGPPAPARLRPPALPSAPARWLFRLLLLVDSSVCSCSLALPPDPARWLFRLLLLASLRPAPRAPSLRPSSALFSPPSPSSCSPSSPPLSSRSPVPGQLPPSAFCLLPVARRLSPLSCSLSSCVLPLSYFLLGRG